MVLFDASFLMFLLDDQVSLPLDPISKQPIPNAKARVEFLIKNITKSKLTIVIPTPALSELLVYAEEAINDWLESLRNEKCFRVVSFDERAAVEAAIAINDAIASGDKRSGSSSNWQKCKFDRQIVAIGRVENVSAIYSTDSDVLKYAQQSRIKAYHIVDLPEPPEEKQGELLLKDS